MSDEPQKDDSSEPLTPIGNGNGRAADGKFAAGHQFAKGNPNNRKAQQLRNAYLRAVTKADITAIVKSMVTLAKAGDVAACREVCDRVLGRPVQQDLLERIEALEKSSAERNQP